jgi:cobyrinic acid a,c-diamide synthase
MVRLFFSAAHKSSGKTTATLGIAAALAVRGLRVQTYKKGPDYIDPLWLKAASGRPCYNLDFHTQTADEIQRCFAGHACAADIALIEGNKGLYDGLDLHGSNSNAALARLLDAPVILVIDARGMTRGIAPLILGYQAFEPDIRIAGVILNRLGGSRHEAKLRAVIEHYTSVPVLGALHEDPALAIVERHLGLIPANEMGEARERIARIADTVSRQVDLDGLLAIARTAPALAQPAPAAGGAVAADLRIGVARDPAFGFYYEGDLEALRATGAELRFFDTLADERLPEVDALFVGGGFPETQMAGLEKNTVMRAAIREFIERGGPVYAECGGLMYLARSIAWRGEKRKMVGALPLDIEMTERPVGRGYTRLRVENAGLWGEAPGTEIPAHEFHYSHPVNVAPDLRFAFAVTRGHGFDGTRDGVIYKNVLANYCHLRHTEMNPWVTRFVRFVRSVTGNQ